jgi:hypothetical protein
MSSDGMQAAIPTPGSSPTTKPAIIGLLKHCHGKRARFPRRARPRIITRNETPVRQGIRAGLAPPLYIEILIQADEPARQVFTSHFD